jgi:hypothetical protein
VPSTPPFALSVDRTGDVIAAEKNVMDHLVTA